jgi:iron(III) transport system permease protein
VIATAGAVIIGTIFAYGMTRTGLSVILSSIGAFFATILGLLIAYLLVCRNFPGRKAMDFLGTLPYAVPGTMMGLGFVVAFNQAPLILTGTAFIIVLDYAIRRMPFGLRSGVSTLKQIDVAREEASADPGAPWFTPFRKIVLPLMKPAFIAGITFAFIRAITELTSTIFRVTPPMESDGCGHIQYGRIRSAGRSGGDVHPAHGHRGHHPVNHLPGDGGNGFHVPDVNDKKRREPTCGMSE